MDIVDQKSNLKDRQYLLKVESFFIYRNFVFNCDFDAEERCCWI